MALRERRLRQQDRPADRHGEIATPVFQLERRLNRGVGMPILQTSSGGTLDVVMEARVIKTNSFDVSLPGKFKSNYQSSNVTAGFRYQWR